MAEVEFAGEKFAVAENIGAMPLMRFAKVAKGGADSNNLDGLVAMYDLLEQCVEPADWARFQAHADKVRASGDDLMAVVGEVFGLVAERPTSRPSASSGGPKNTKLRSVSGSPVKVVRRLEKQGRPDLAVFIEDAAKARSARSA